MNEPTYGFDSFRIGQRLMGYLLIFILILLLTLSAVNFPFAKNPLPPPFEAIKREALKCDPDNEGDYSWKRQIAKNGAIVGYLMGYYPKQDVLVIAKQSGPYFGAVIYSGAENIYVTQSYVYGRLVHQVAIPEEEACEKAYMVFREIVANHLI